MLTRYNHLSGYIGGSLMSEITAIQSASARTGLVAPAEQPRVLDWLRNLGFRPDFVLIGLAVLFLGLWGYSADQALKTALYVADELAQIAPWLIASVSIAAAARAPG